jgi:hypothetical protein
MLSPFYINARGKLVDRVRYPFGGKVIFPLFEVYSSPTITIGEVKRRRFDLIDRMVQQTRQEIMSQQDTEIFNKLDDLTVAPPAPSEPETIEEIPEGWDDGPHDFWCEGCGEPRYKCYCDTICPLGCGKWEKDCLGECQE